MIARLDKKGDIYSSYFGENHFLPPFDSSEKLAEIKIRKCFWVK
jgi:hypothetical protein